MNYQDIPNLTRSGSYEVNSSLDFLNETITGYQKSDSTFRGLDLLPDFQRGHVWTESQQVAFVEFFLRGGMSGRVIYLNCPNWGHFEPIPEGQYNEFVIVDGLQRLTAMLKFVRGELPVFGHYCLPKGTEPVPGRKYFEGRLRCLRAGDNLKININCLKTRAEVLKWYLEMNEGGTPHTDKELDKVRQMLKEEKA